jgi:hypothetical protein
MRHVDPLIDMMFQEGAVRAIYVIAVCTKIFPTDWFL